MVPWVKCKQRTSPACGFPRFGRLANLLLQFKPRFHSSALDQKHNQKHASSSPFYALHPLQTSPKTARTFAFTFYSRSAMFFSSVSQASRRVVLRGAVRRAHQHAAPITPTHHPKVTQLLIDGKVGGQIEGSGRVGGFSGVGGWRSLLCLVACSERGVRVCFSFES